MCSGRRRFVLRQVQLAVALGTAGATEAAELEWEASVETSTAGDAAQHNAFWKHVGMGLRVGTRCSAGPD